ncbi:MAG: six-cysteine ranthipeptide SCIFF [Veillonella sp.]|nr:six-cysteine ranthipeptide SCIFF [Veillonella sp.]
MAKRIRTINTESLQKTAKTGGCGECQTSCQSAWARLAGLFYLCFKDIHCIVYLYDSFYNV